ncbi:hypothetical protein BCY84_22049 [Trypanosoma cruzi cruzi]|nr:hypothetical protein BCY84_22049 [Trypanosoma cruzi cruzi]
MSEKPDKGPAFLSDTKGPHQVQKNERKKKTDCVSAKEQRENIFTEEQLIALLSDTH